MSPGRTKGGGSDFRDRGSILAAEPRGKPALSLLLSGAGKPVDRDQGEKQTESGKQKGASSSGKASLFCCAKKKLNGVEKSFREKGKKRRNRRTARYERGQGRARIPPPSFGREERIERLASPKGRKDDHRR